MSLETEVAGLTSATTALTNAVAQQQLNVSSSVANFADIINKVNTEVNLVDNTSDADKPLSDAAITESATKQATLVDGVNISTVNGVSLLGGTPLVIERSKTELETLIYENRGNLRTPSTPLPSSDDSVVIEGIGLLIFVGTTLEPDDDETCFTAVDPVTSIPFGQWLLNVAAPDLQSAWATDDRNFRDELDEDETSRLTPFFVTK
jgi:hypothetical protein